MNADTAAARALSARVVRCAALALAIVCAAPRAAPAQIGGDVRCLYDVLPTPVRLRLELASRTGEGLPQAAPAALGEDGLANLLTACGFEPGPDAMATMARYWVARAAFEMSRERLRVAGLPLAVAESAFASAAPQEALVDLAADLLAAQSIVSGDAGSSDETAGEAAAAVVALVVDAVETEVARRRRAQADAVAQAQAEADEGAPWLNPDADEAAFLLSPPERLLVAEFAASALLSRGVAAGARAPTVD